jgi:N-acyl homoserine lactone hydrolase
LLGTAHNAADHARAPQPGHCDRQPGKAGYKTSDINQVALGRMHLDHVGDIRKFPNATTIYQRDEMLNAFWPKPGCGAHRT